jgi:hypothetical protein
MCSPQKGKTPSNPTANDRQANQMRTPDAHHPPPPPDLRFPSTRHARAYLVALPVAILAVVATIVVTASGPPCTGDTRDTCPNAPPIIIVPLAVIAIVVIYLTWLAHRIAAGQQATQPHTPRRRPHPLQLRPWQVVFYTLAFGLLVPVAVRQLRTPPRPDPDPGA